jgi:hypothetical protein
MQYSNLRQAFKNVADCADRIVRIYERLRHDERVNDEPLFWLQYAIAMVNGGDLAAAQQFIDTAYARAKERPGFQTYQIDTQAFRILLLIESEATPGRQVAHIQAIIEKLELLNSMLQAESHRIHAVRVLEGMLLFVERRAGDMTSGEKTAVTFWLATLIRTISQLPLEFRLTSGSDRVSAMLGSAKNLLL